MLEISSALFLPMIQALRTLSIKMSLPVPSKLLLVYISIQVCFLPFLRQYHISPITLISSILLFLYFFLALLQLNFQSLLLQHQLSDFLLELMFLLLKLLVFQLKRANGKQMLFYQIAVTGIFLIEGGPEIIYLFLQPNQNFILPCYQYQIICSLFFQPKFHYIYCSFYALRIAFSLCNSRISLRTSLPLTNNLYYLPTFNGTLDILILFNLDSFRFFLKVQSRICSRNDPLRGEGVSALGSEDVERERCPNLFAGDRKVDFGWQQLLRYCLLWLQRCAYILVQFKHNNIQESSKSILIAVSRKPEQLFILIKGCVLFLSTWQSRVQLSKSLTFRQPLFFKLRAASSRRDKDWQKKAMMAPLYNRLSTAQIIYGKLQFPINKKFVYFWACSFNWFHYTNFTLCCFQTEIFACSTIGNCFIAKGFETKAVTLVAPLRITPASRRPLP